MSVSVGVPADLTQCERASIAWAGTKGLDKTIQAFVQGTRYFAETLNPNEDLSGGAGSMSWLVDLPGGLTIAIEIRNRNSTIHATSSWRTILPGETDACLGKNAGQLEPASMSSFAASLSSASPSLFPYASTTAPFSSTSVTATIVMQAPSTDNNTNVGVIVGATIGAVAGVVILAALGIWLVVRRRRQRRSDEATTLASTRSVDERSVGNGLASTPVTPMRRVDTWRQATRPLSNGHLDHIVGAAIPQQFSQGPRPGVPEVQDAMQQDQMTQYATAGEDVSPTIRRASMYGPTQYLDHPDTFAVAGPSSYVATSGSQASYPSYR